MEPRGSLGPEGGGPASAPAGRRPLGPRPPEPVGPMGAGGPRTLREQAEQAGSAGGARPRPPTRAGAREAPGGAGSGLGGQRRERPGVTEGRAEPQTRPAYRGPPAQMAEGCGRGFWGVPRSRHPGSVLRPCRDPADGPSPQPCGLRARRGRGLERRPGPPSAPPPSLCGAPRPAPGPRGGGRRRWREGRGQGQRPGPRTPNPGNAGRQRTLETRVKTRSSVFPCKSGFGKSETGKVMET